MHALHRIKIKLADGITIEIESSSGAEGNAWNAHDLPWLVDAVDEVGTFDRSAAIPPICFRTAAELLFEPLQLREETEYFVDVLVPMPLSEARQKWVGDRSWPLKTLESAYVSDPPKRWRETSEGTVIPGSLNFGAYVGVAAISVLGSPPIHLEVACRKLTYFDDFLALIDAIAEEYTGLLLEIDAPTFARLGMDNLPDDRLLTAVFLVRHIMQPANLPAAIESILDSPRSGLAVEMNRYPTAWASRVRPSDVVADISRLSFVSGGPLADVFRGHTPTYLPVQEKHETYDTVENRYVKAFLETLRELTLALAETLAVRHRKKTASELAIAASQVSDWLDHPMWNEVGPMSHLPANSQVLQKAPHYREVLIADLRLGCGLSVPWRSDFSPGETAEGEMKPISQLYEYWCFFALKSAVERVCGAPRAGGSTLIVEEEGGLVVNLRRGVESRIAYDFQNLKGERAEVTLYYNRRFLRNRINNKWTGSYSTSLNPDFSLQVVSKSGGVSMIHWLHFDAKYRLDIKEWQQRFDSLGTEAASSGKEDTIRNDTYKMNDLFKMHTYRDALLGSRGSFVLFPGSLIQEDVFIRYPGVEYDTAPFRFPSVGAFQLAPAQAESQIVQIENFLRHCFENLCGLSVYTEELGMYAPKQPHHQEDGSSAGF